MDTAEIDIPTTQIEETVRKIQRGEQKELETFVRLTQDRLFRFCIHISSDPLLAEDLVSETYLKVFPSFDQIDDPKGVFAWLFTIARNLFIDRCRKASSKNEILQKPDPESPDSDPMANFSDDSRHQKDLDTLILVRNTLSQLEPDERTLLVLVDHEEYSYGEAAKIIGISESAVRSRLHRARKRFMELIKKQ